MKNFLKKLYQDIKNFFNINFRKEISKIKILFFEAKSA